VSRLYRLKAECFKTLGNPARIRALELLSERERTVSQMLPEVGIGPAHLSQQRAVSRRANLSAGYRWRDLRRWQYRGIPAARPAPSAKGALVWPRSSE